MSIGPYLFALAAPQLVKLLKKFFTTLKEQPPKAAKGKEKPKEHKLYANAVIGKFVTCNKGFANVLKGIPKTVEDYLRRPSPSKSLNIVIAAPPGSGKSFLVKQLSEAVRTSFKDEPKVVFDEYHVAAMTDVEDLIDCFRRIQSHNLEGKVPIVFFDEADAQVGGHQIFAHLLAPMADGKFYHRGHANCLGKAVLVFAGSSLFVTDPNTPKPRTKKSQTGATRLPDYKTWADKQEAALKRRLRGKNATEKLSDFGDRIDIIVCVPSIRMKLRDGDRDDDLKALALLLVKKHFENVNKVEFAAAQALMAMLLQAASIRQGESTIFLSTAPRDDTFTFANLPQTVQTQCQKFTHAARGCYYVLVK